MAEKDTPPRKKPVTKKQQLNKEQKTAVEASDKKPEPTEQQITADGIQSGLNTKIHPLPEKQ